MRKLLLAAIIGLFLLQTSSMTYAQTFSGRDTVGLSPEYRQTKYNKYLKDGVDAAKRNKLQEALKNFLNAIEMQETYDVWRKVGDVYDRLGEKKKATEAYKRAADLLERETNLADTIIESYKGRIVLSEPFENGRNNSFFSLVHISPLVGARTMPEERLYLKTGVEVSQTDYEEDGEGGKNNYNARLYESFFEARYGVTHNLELSAKVTLGFLSEIDTDIFIYENNLQIVPAGTRSIGPSDIYLSAKWQFWKAEDEFTGFSVASSIKVPVADDKNFLSAGTVDWALNFALSYRFGDIILHSNLGYTFLFRSQSVMADSIDFNDCVSGGFALSYFLKDNASICFQVEANTSPFSNELSDLKATPVTALFGGKYKMQEGFILEGAIGVGFGKLSSDFMGVFSLGKHF